jgi:hypothetical protein
MHYAPALILSKSGPPRSPPAPVSRGPSPKELFFTFGTNKVAVVMVLIEIMSKQVQLSIEPGSLCKRA